jgi:hypothetical protein
MNDIQPIMREAEDLVRQALGLIMKSHEPTTPSLYDRAEFAIRRLTSFLGDQADLMDLHPDLSLTLQDIGDNAGEIPLPPYLVAWIRRERELVPDSDVVH